MAKFALEMADGSVAIMETVGAVSPEDCIAKWPEAERAKVVSHKPVEPANIPADRTFRNAWNLNGDAIDHDMTKAREIHQARIEKAAERQKVEVPVVDLSKATTPEDLKAVWPAELGDRARR